MKRAKRKGEARAGKEAASAGAGRGEEKQEEGCESSRK